MIFKEGAQHLGNARARGECEVNLARAYCGGCVAATGSRSRLIHESAGQSIGRTRNTRRRGRSW